MAQVYKFSEEEIEEIVQARRENKEKRVEARLKALEMRARNVKASEIAELTGFHSAYISQLAAKYKNGGIEAITGNHYGGNRRKRYPSKCALSPYPGVLLCLWCRGAADGRALLLGTSPVQYGLHEFLSPGVIQSVPE